MNRYPRPTYPLTQNPAGWFAVAYSHEVVPGSIHEVQAIGRELCLFRAGDGTVAVIDAFCPHMGANLCVGGVVEGNCVRCPFHRWAFAPSGACVDIPYAKKIPPAARIEALPIRERNGVVLVWHHPRGEAPSFEIPAFEEAPWSKPRWLDLEYEMHLQEVAENGVDIAHFPAVHACSRGSVAMIDGKSMPFRFELRTAYDGDGIGVPGKFVDVTTAWAYWGPSMFHAVSTADGFGTRVRHLFHFTPIPGGRLRFRVALSVDASTVPAASVDFVGRRNAEITKANLDEDSPIWARKKYLMRPVLTANDGPLGMLRRWGRRFYETAAPEIAASPAAPNTVEPDAVEPDFDDREQRMYELAPLANAAPAAPPANTVARPVVETVVSREAVRRVFVEKLLRDFRPGVASRAFTVQYEVTGEAGGAWYLEVDADRFRPCEGKHGAPEVTVTIAAEDWLGLHEGRLDGPEAFMSGKLVIAGDFDLAASLGQVFPPS
jgi:3-ketosteroid 9alpha-monooxygenase subunit A